MTRTPTARRPALPTVAGPVPVRVRHSKGGGAFGHFTVTGDVSAYTAADLFQPGRVTEALVRFSGTLGFLGTPDVWRDVRGFAVKFFTADGEYDLVGNNTPVFFVRDEALFASLVVAQKLYQDDRLFDHDELWRFLVAHPETAHQITWLFGDRGLPRSWRHQDGFGSHTFQWTNADGERFWVKYHLRSDQGTDALTDVEATALGDELQHRAADLRDAIDRGEHPSWTVSVQILPYEQALTYRFNPFDLTKVWPKGDLPLIEVGRLVLDRNPQDELGEIEQAGFAPSSFVPGIGPSPDPMLLSRVRSYWRFHQHRVNPEVAALPVVPPLDDTAEPWDEAFTISAVTPHAEDDDFVQAGTLVRDVLDDAARERLAHNAAGQVTAITDHELRGQVVAYWTQVDATLGARVAEIAGVSVS